MRSGRMRCHGWRIRYTNTKSCLASDDKRVLIAPHASRISISKDTCMHAADAGERRRMSSTCTHPPTTPVSAHISVNCIRFGSATLKSQFAPDQRTASGGGFPCHCCVCAAACKRHSRGMSHTRRRRWRRRH